MRFKIIKCNLILRSTGNSTIEQQFKNRVEISFGYSILKNKIFYLQTICYIAQNLEFHFAFLYKKPKSKIQIGIVILNPIKKIVVSNLFFK